MSFFGTLHEVLHWLVERRHELAFQYMFDYGKKLDSMAKGLTGFIMLDCNFNILYCSCSR
jgi:hypothetical protein